MVFTRWVTEKRVAHSDWIRNCKKFFYDLSKRISIRSVVGLKIIFSFISPKFNFKQLVIQFQKHLIDIPLLGAEQFLYLKHSGLSNSNMV
jgi:hypothetical protein